MINKNGNGAVVQIANVFGTVYDVACWKVLLNGSF